MKIFIETLAEVDRKAWDERVCSVPEGTFNQSVGMAQISAKAYNDLTYFLRVEEDGQTLGQLLLLETIPYPRRLLRGLSRRACEPLVRRFFRRLQWDHGPLVFDPERADFISESLIEAVLDHLAPGAVEVRGTLPIHDPVVEPAKLHPILERYGFEGREWGTALIDLRVPPEERRKKLTKGTRYDIRKAQRDGIEVSEIATEEELMEYYGVLREAARRNRVAPVLFTALAESWRSNNQRYRNSIFLARHQGHIVAGLQAQTFNGVVVQGSVVTSNYGHERRLFGMHLLVWHLIEWGHRQGGRYLDLAGVNPNAEASSSKEAGIYFFKSRWGGEFVKYQIYTKPTSTLRYRFLQRIRRH